MIFQGGGGAGPPVPHSGSAHVMSIQNTYCFVKSIQLAGLQIGVIINWFSYFLTEAYVVGTQKNPLNETVLLSTQNICLD